MDPSWDDSPETGDTSVVLAFFFLGAMLAPPPCDRENMDAHPRIPQPFLSLPSLEPPERVQRSSLMEPARDTDSLGELSGELPFSLWFFLFLPPLCLSLCILVFS